MCRAAHPGCRGPGLDLLAAARRAPHRRHGRAHPPANVQGWLCAGIAFCAGIANVQGSLFVRTVLTTQFV